MREKEDEERRVENLEQEEEADLQKRQFKIQILAMQVREKDKEGRLCELKLKELRRSHRHGTLLPLAAKHNINIR